MIKATFPIALLLLACCLSGCDRKEQPASEAAADSAQELLKSADKVSDQAAKELRQSLETELD